MPIKKNTSDRELEELNGTVEVDVTVQTQPVVEAPEVEEESQDAPEETNHKAFLVAEEVAEPAPVDVQSSPEQPSSPVEKEETARIFPRSTMERGDSDRTPKWLLWVTIILVTLATVVVGAIVVMRKGSQGTTPEPTVMAEPTVEPTATPTPAPAISRSDLKVQVLNGSGITGKAATAKTYLEDLGYEDITTGNASSTDYETTEISVKKSKQTAADVIKKDLEDEYTIASKIGTLEEDDTYDVVIILGTE